MKQKESKFKVKPGLSLTSKDIYRRYKNNSLNAIQGGQYGLDTEVQEFTRMSKPEQLNSMKNTFQEIQNLKNAQPRKD